MDEVDMAANQFAEGGRGTLVEVTAQQGGVITRW